MPKINRGALPISTKYQFVLLTMMTLKTGASTYMIKAEIYIKGTFL